MKHEVDSKVKKVSYHDLMTASSSEIKKTYKLNDRQLEQAVRRHHDGASASERRSFYEQVYNKRK